MSVFCRNIFKFGCVKVLDGMIIMRVISQANRSHTHLLKYTQYAKHSPDALNKVIATQTVAQFLDLASQCNRAEILSQVPPLGKRSRHTEKIQLLHWKLVLCIQDGSDIIWLQIRYQLIVASHRYTGIEITRLRIYRVKVLHVCCSSRFRYIYYNTLCKSGNS